jgi:O-antigen/teichoic acid export membrane protein
MISAIMGRATKVARKDTSIVLLGAVASNIARLLSTVVLTRVLDPSAYGVVGILSSIGFTIAMLTDVGIYSYVVRHDRNNDPVFLDQVWTVRLVRCLGLMVLTIALAPILAAALDKPITLALMVYSLTFAMEGFSSMTFATAVRQRQLIRLAIMDVAPQLFSVAVALAFGLWLRSYWALIIAMLASGAFNGVLSYALYPHSRRKWHYSREMASDVWAFGRNLSASSVVYLGLSQIDKVVLARIFPIATFGLYSISTTLIAAVRMFNRNYALRILFPAFASVKNAGPQAQTSVFYATGREIRLLYSLVAGGVVTCAPLIIRLLYDPRYAQAATFLEILAIGNLFSLSSFASNEMLMALGRTRHLLQGNIARLIFFAIAGPTGFYMFGPLGLVGAVAGMELIAQIYNWYALARDGVFSLRGELPYWAVTAAGLALGSIVNALALDFLPR